jgi:hypothetical protein
MDGDPAPPGARAGPPIEMGDATPVERPDGARDVAGLVDLLAPCARLSAPSGGLLTPLRPAAGMPAIAENDGECCLAMPIPSPPRPAADPVIPPRPPTPPAGAGDSISSPSRSLLLPSCPIPNASTASSSTAGTVWSSAEPCARFKREGRCESDLSLPEPGCECDPIPELGPSERACTAGTSISRSKMAEVDECMDAGEPGRERCGLSAEPAPADALPAVPNVPDCERFAKPACVGDEDEWCGNGGGEVEVEVPLIGAPRSGDDMVEADAPSRSLSPLDTALDRSDACACPLGEAPRDAELPTWWLCTGAGERAR